MKKLNFLLVASLMAFSLVACGASKNASSNSTSTQSSVQEQKDRLAQQREELEMLKLQQELELEKMRMEAEMAKLKNDMAIEQLKNEKILAGEAYAGTIVDVPCMDVSYDDENFFRELGEGTVVGNNAGLARQEALKNAKDMLKGRFGEFVQGVTTSYFGSYVGSKPQASAQSKAASIMNGVVEKMMNDADKECERRTIDPKGNVKVYYVIRVSKGDMKKQMIDALSADEKLGIDFNADQMQKFMDERMTEMQEAKRNAGY